MSDPTAGERAPGQDTYKRYSSLSGDVGTFKPFSALVAEAEPKKRALASVPVGGEVRNPLAGELEKKEEEASILKELIPFFTELKTLYHEFEKIKESYDISDIKDIEEVFNETENVINAAKEKPTRESVRAAENEILYVRALIKQIKEKAEATSTKKELKEEEGAVLRDLLPLAAEVASIEARAEQLLSSNPDMARRIAELKKLLEDAAAGSSTEKRDDLKKRLEETRNYINLVLSTSKTPSSTPAPAPVPTPVSTIPVSSTTPKPGPASAPKAGSPVATPKVTTPASSPSPAPAASRPTTPDKGGEPATQENRRFKEGDAVRLMDQKTGRIDEWTITGIERKGNLTFAAVENKILGKRHVEIATLRKFVEETKMYESRNEEVSFPPLKELLSGFSPKTNFNEKSMLSWKRKWVDSGKIDTFRKENGNISISNEQIEDARKALNFYAEAIADNDVPGDVKRTASQNIIVSARILTGVQHPKQNDIEFYVTNNILNGPAIEVARTTIEKAKRRVLHPGGHIPRLFVGWKKGEYDPQKEEEERKRREEVPAELMEKHKEMYSRAPDEYMQTYLSFYRDASGQPVRDEEGNITYEKDEHGNYYFNKRIENEKITKEAVSKVLLEHNILVPNASKEELKMEREKEKAAEREPKREHRLTYSPSVEAFGNRGRTLPEDDRPEEQKLQDQISPRSAGFRTVEEMLDSPHGAGMVRPETTPTNNHATEPRLGTPARQEKRSRLREVADLLGLRSEKFKLTKWAGSTPLWVFLAVPAFVAGTGYGAYRAYEKQTSSIESSAAAAPKKNYLEWRSYLNSANQKEMTIANDAVKLTPQELVEKYVPSYVKKGDSVAAGNLLSRDDANKILSANYEHVLGLTDEQRAEAHIFIYTVQKVAQSMLAAAQERTKQNHVLYSLAVSREIPQGTPIKDYILAVQKAEGVLKS